MDVCWRDGNWYSWPASMLEKHNDVVYLRMRATFQSLVQLLTNGKAGKNSSLASSKQLANLVEMRNQSAQIQEQGDLFAAEDEGSGEDKETHNTEPAPEPSAKKRKCVPGGVYTVKVVVQGTIVEFLMQGTRPARSDLLVKHDTDMLAAVFDYLSVDAEKCLNAPTRQYKKAKGSS